MGALLGAGKRLITGESLFMTVFTNSGGGKQQVAFAAPYPGKILAMDLKQLGGTADLPEGLVPVRGARRVDRHRVPAEDRRRPVRRRGLHHAEARGRRPLLRARRRHGASARARPPGRRCASTPAVSSRCSRSVGYDIQFVGKIKTALFGGEGLFFATLTGPGRVWLQSLPFSRMADRIYKAAPAAGGSRREGGSILGGLGDLLDGDSTR